jgi:hypothetical protein
VALRTGEKDHPHFAAVRLQSARGEEERFEDLPVLSNQRSRGFQKFADPWQGQLHGGGSVTSFV